MNSDQPKTPAQKIAQLQKLLDRISKDSNAAHALAQEIYGREASVFCESEGTIHVMDGNSEEGAQERQAHIKLSSNYAHRLGVGSW